MKAIQNEALMKIASMTDLGILKWHKRDNDDLRWVKMKSIRILMSMNPDIDEIYLETERGSMIIKGGTPIVREAVLNYEREIQ